MEHITELAKFFLSKEDMTHKKLQKLCYYAQAWYLANTGTPLIESHFEAWVHGPVSPELYSQYRSYGWAPISIPKTTRINLRDPKISNFLELVYKTYGHYSGDELESLTHKEKPWQEARQGYAPSEYCREAILESTMRDYYKKRLNKK